jgi:hypothetical protein
MLALLFFALAAGVHGFTQEVVEVDLGTEGDHERHVVPVVLPDAYHDTDAKYPVVLLLHGFCTPPRWQEFLTLVSTQGIFGDPGPSVLTQVTRPLLLSADG